MSTKYYMPALIVLFNCSCGQENMSTRIDDSDAGFNGSFEITKDGLPVNWDLYTVETVPSGDFTINLDTNDAKDGQHSLNFSVKECSSDGGWYSPGIAKEIDAKPDEKYIIDFWLKNDQSEFEIKIGGVSAFDGNLETIVKSTEQIDSWKKYEYNYTIPKKMNAIRFELNILQPGEFWIDLVNISKVQ